VAPVVAWFAPTCKNYNKISELQVTAGAGATGVVDFLK